MHDRSDHGAALLGCLTITYTADGRPVHFSLAICRQPHGQFLARWADPLKKPASKAKKAKPSERRYRSARWDSLTITHQTTTADATRETTGHLLRNCNLDATQTVRA